jgi:deoxycytidine triphosphate deaminase
MILTDREIQAALAAKQVIIDPLPRGDAYSATSVDLTLGPKIRFWKDEQVQGVEPRSSIHPRRAIATQRSLMSIQKHSILTPMATFLSRRGLYSGGRMSALNCRHPRG